MSSKLRQLDDLRIKGCFIAGGAVLSVATKKDISDYDVYPKNFKGFEDALLTVLEDSNSFIVNISDRAITVKTNEITDSEGKRAIVQIMTYDFFETAEKIFENFDFTVCMGAYDCDTKEYVLHEDFYPDIATKTLRFNHKTRYPLNSLLRVGKYREKGFFISKPELTKIAITIGARGMPESWEALESEIGGSYGREISLGCEDREFNLENAMDVLSTMMTDFEAWEEENADKFKDVEVDDLMAYATQAPITYANLPKKDFLYTTMHGSKKFVITDDGEIRHMIDEEILKVLPGELNLKEIDTRLLYGYKLLKATDDPNVFLPGVHKSKFEYKLDEEAVELKDPHLFVCKTYGEAKSRRGYGNPANKPRIFKVSFDIGDVASVADTEIQVKKLRICEEIKDSENDQS